MAYRSISILKNEIRQLIEEIMATEVLSIHSMTPELRKIRKVVDALHQGAVILYPTDTGFTLGCNLSNKDGVNRIRQIRRLDPDKRLTFLCYSLSNISEFAKVSNSAYRFIKRLIPGPYTFILPASKLVPKYAVDTKRKTTGIRVPEHTLSQLLLKELAHPIISISAKTENHDHYSDPEEIIERYRPLVDIAVSSDDYDFVGESTVIDMMTDDFSFIREGAGLTLAQEFINNY